MAKESKAEEKEKQEKEREEFFALLKKGHDSGGYKMYKNRDELYD